MSNGSNFVKQIVKKITILTQTVKESERILSPFSVKVSFLIVGFLFIGCGGSKKDPIEQTEKNLNCYSFEKNSYMDETTYLGKSAHKNSSYSEIVNTVRATCNSCHLAPAASGNFSYIDNYESQEKSIDGVFKKWPGLKDAGPKIVEYVTHSDENKKMPPTERRKSNPQFYESFGRQLLGWQASNYTNGEFPVDSKKSSFTKNKFPLKKSSELGECIPKPSSIGFDFFKDRQFAAMTKLPKDLADTDIFTFDSYELAQKGTLAYNVAYPLWADNADKGRWVHFPMGIEKGNLVRMTAKYINDGSAFEIPENTRFYKNFYKQILTSEGKKRFKRIETRLILVRKPWEKSLFGTYKWDDSEQTATLHEVPYRDGTSFKDLVFEVTVDEQKNKKREYAIPGGARCIECHQGSPNDFILGFTPLQLNHRESGFGGRDKPINSAEKSQVERLISYGVIVGSPNLVDWPKLERLGPAAPKNEYELKASAYMVGNCSHCHNPSGLAVKGENGVSLILTPGAIFGFNTHLKSSQIPSRALINKNGELDTSHIYRKISDNSQQLGITSQMPMNTPGGPDCNVISVIGKWIKSFESDQAAESFSPSCKKENSLNWIDQDFTSSKDATYIPRRTDWANSSAGMSPKFRSLEFSENLKKAASKQYAVGYWNSKDECDFPQRNLERNQIRPWMLRLGKPKRPFGEIYYTTPGSWYYRTSCAKCHGPKADGVSSLARGIMMWSGGSVTVANLIGGMFGKKNENLNLFQVDGKNYAPNYLVWMAMEGTKVKFPNELSSYLGKHGGQMLNQMREKCINQISTDKPSNPNFHDHEIFKEVCFIDNLKPGHPDLTYNDETNEPLNKEAVDNWADKAAFNIGYSIFEFLKEGSDGRWIIGNDQCEKVFPKKEN